MERVEDVVGRWHSAKAVLLLLREELHQMRDFIDRLRIRQTQYTSPANLNDLGGSVGSDGQVRRLDSIEEALRVVCDRLDALVTVCDAVLDNRAAELLAADPGEVSGCLTGSAVVNEVGFERRIADETAGEEYVRLQAENRQLFDQIVDLMRHVNETNVHDVAVVESRFQPQQTDRSQSDGYSKEVTDTDRVSDSTEANSSNDSSYATCDAFSSGSASPDVRVQPAFEVIATDFTSSANETQLLSDPTNTEAIRESSDMGAMEGGTVLGCEEQTYRSALELLRREKTLLQLQRQSNATLHRELVQLSGENRILQSTINELRTSVDLKNNELLTLTNKADHVSRLLDEQVEEFRCVFRAVTRESDKELERLATENTRLKSTLATMNTAGGFTGQGPSENKPPPGYSTSADGETYETTVRENVVCVIPQQLQTEVASSKGRTERVNPGTEDEVRCFSQRFDDVSYKDRAEPGTFIPPQRSSIELHRLRPAAQQVVAVHCIEDLWSEIDALEKMALPEERRCLATDVAENGRLLSSGDWDDSGTVTQSDNNDTAGADEGNATGFESMHLPLSMDDVFCYDQSLNPCSTPVMMSPRGASTALQTGEDFQRNHEETKSDELARNILSELNGSVKNEVHGNHLGPNVQTIPFPIVDKLQNSLLPDAKLLRHAQTKRLSRSCSDSCLLSKFHASGLHGHHEISSCNCDCSAGIHEPYRYRLPSRGSFRQRYPEQPGTDIRHAAMQTDGQESHNDDGNRDDQIGEDGIKISDQVYTVSCDNILDVYDSLKCELQRLRELTASDDFDIINKYRVDEFCSGDVQLIATHLKHHVEEKIMLDEENRLLVDEVGRLLSELLKLGINRLPVIVEESNAEVEFEVDKDEVEIMDLNSSMFGAEENIEESYDLEDCRPKHRSAECATDKIDAATGVHSFELGYIDQDRAATTKTVSETNIASDPQDMVLPVHLWHSSHPQYDQQLSPGSKFRKGDRLQKEILQLRTSLQQSQADFQQELLRRTEEIVHLHDQLMSLHSQRSVQPLIIRSDQYTTEERTSAEPDVRRKELNDLKWLYKTAGENTLLQVQSLGNDELRVHSDDLCRLLEDAMHQSVEGKYLSPDKERMRAKIAEDERDKTSSVDEGLIVNTDHVQQHNVIALLENRHAAYGECEVRSAVDGSSGNVKRLETIGNTLQVESPQNIDDLDNLLVDSDTGLVTESCIRKCPAETSSESRSAAGSVLYVGPLPFSCTNEYASLGDLVHQLRQQNARLACYISVVNSLFRQWEYSRTTERSLDPQLQTNILGFAGSGTTSSDPDPEQLGDNPATVSPRLPLLTSLPFMAISAICLERPLVVDLTSRR